MPTGEQFMFPVLAVIGVVGFALFRKYAPQGAQENVSDRLRYVLNECPTDRYELFCGVIALALSLWFSLFHVFNSYKNFVAMPRIMPEESWGTLLCVYGLLQLGCLFFGSRDHRVVAMILGTMLWIFLSSVFLTANLPSLAGPVFGIIGAVGFLGVRRLVRGSTP